MAVITGANIPRFSLAIIEQGLKLEAKGMRSSKRFTPARFARVLLTEAGMKAPRNKQKLLEAFQAYRAKKDAELAQAAQAGAAQAELDLK